MIVIFGWLERGTIVVTQSLNFEHNRFLVSACVNFLVLLEQLIKLLEWNHQTEGKYYDFEHNGYGVSPLES